MKKAWIKKNKIEEYLPEGTTHRYTSTGDYWVKVKYDNKTVAIDIEASCLNSSKDYKNKWVASIPIRYKHEDKTYRLNVNPSDLVYQDPTKKESEVARKKWERENYLFTRIMMVAFFAFIYFVPPLVFEFTISGSLYIYFVSIYGLCYMLGYLFNRAIDNAWKLYWLGTKLGSLSDEDKKIVKGSLF